MKHRIDASEKECFMIMLFKRRIFLKKSEQMKWLNNLKGHLSDWINSDIKVFELLKYVSVMFKEKEWPVHHKRIIQCVS